MKLVIPSHLTEINVVLQMYMLMNKYSESGYEEYVDSNDYLQRDRNFDYIRNFIERTGNRDSFTNEYLINLFYKLKGNYKVFSEMEKHLGLKFKEIHYDINHLDYSLESAATNDNSDYFSMLKNFLRSLLYFVNDGTDPNGNDSELEDPIDNSDYVFTTDKGETRVVINNDKESSEGTVGIISTKDGENHGYKITTNNEWIHVTIDENGDIHYELDENDTNSDRVGVITAVQDDSGKVITIVITQSSEGGGIIDPDNPDYIFTDSKGSTSIKDKSHNNSSDSFIGSTDIISTKGGKDIGYSVSSNVSWIIPIIDENGDIKYKVDENINDEPRIGVITAVQDGSGKVITITVTQGGANGTSYPDPDPSSKYIFTDWEGNKNAIDNRHSGSTSQFTDSWDIISTKDGFPLGYTASSNSPWLTVTIDTNGNLLYTATVNTSTNPRVGVITLIQNETGNVITLVVTQGGVKINPDDHTYIFTDTEGEIENEDERYKKNKEPFKDSWELISTRDNKDFVDFTVSTNVNWLKVWAENGSIVYEVKDSNESDKPRTAVITAIQKESYNIFILTVTQGSINVDPEEPDLPTNPDADLDLMNLLVDDKMSVIGGVNLILYKEYSYNFEDGDDD